MAGISFDALNFFFIQFADYFCGRTDDKTVVWEGFVLRDKRSGSDNAVIADARTIHKDGTHAYDAAVADRTAMNDGTVAYGDMRTDCYIIIGHSGMNHNQILNIGVIADGYGKGIRTKNGIVPDGYVLSACDIAVNYCVFSDVYCVHDYILVDPLKR